jgi:hypothetical protein
MHQCQRLVHPSKNFGTGFVEWPSEYHCITPDVNQYHQNAFLSMFPLSSGTEKSHWGPDPMNSEGVPAQLFVY